MPSASVSSSCRMRKIPPATARSSAATGRPLSNHAASVRTGQPVKRGGETDFSSSTPRWNASVLNRRATIGSVSTSTRFTSTCRSPPCTSCSYSSLWEIPLLSPRCRDLAPAHRLSLPAGHPPGRLRERHRRWRTPTGAREPVAQSCRMVKAHSRLTRSPSRRERSPGGARFRRFFLADRKPLRVEACPRLRCAAAGTSIGRQASLRVARSLVAGQERATRHRAGRTSVFAKSSPLNRRGSPVTLASA